MPKFVFPLEPVLGFRKRREDEQQLVFAAAFAIQQREQQVCDRYFARRTEIREHILHHHREMDTDDLRMAYAHCDYLDRAIVEQQGVIEMARAATEAERLILIELTKQKKILETLKERRREAFVAEVAAIDQRESDDINARRYDRANDFRETPV